MTPKTEYLDLIKDVESYLHDQHLADAWIEVCQESYVEYKNWYVQSKKTIQNNPIITAPSERPPLDAPLKTEYKKTEYKKPEYKKPEYKAVVEAPAPLFIESPLKEEKRSTSNGVDFTDIKKIIKEKLSDLNIIDTIPDDSRAKTLKSQWKSAYLSPDLLFIVNAPNSHQLSFLKNVCHAVQISLNCHAKIHDKKTAGSGLADCPSIEMNDIDLYFREPLLKKELWNSIINRLELKI